MPTSKTATLRRPLRHLQKLITKFPESKLLDRAHYRWGEYAYAANDYKTAADEYQRVVLKWPEQPVGAARLVRPGLVAAQSAGPCRGGEIVHHARGRLSAG